MVTGRDIVRAARGCIGTPYLHNGRVPGAGLDCAGLIEAAAQGAGLTFEIPTAYRQDNDAAAVVKEARRVLGTPTRDLDKGDVVVLRKGRRHYHLGIYTGTGMVEASNAPECAEVMESRMSEREIKAQLLGAWRIPGVVV